MNDHNQNGQTLKEKLRAKMDHIKGRALDADPKNDPTYPIRLRSKRMDTDWERPPQQPAHEETLHSSGHSDVTRVLGTAAPVSGLSDSPHRRAFVGAAVVVGVLAAVYFRRHLTPHTRHIPGLWHKYSKLQAFIRDYERMMRP